MRTIEFNIKKTIDIFSKYDIDYFIHITDNEEEDTYINSNVNINSVIDLIKPKMVIREYEHKNKDEYFKNMRNMWYKIGVLIDSVFKYSKFNNINYDLFLKIRPDLYILSDSIIIDSNILDNTIYGNNDDFFYGKPHIFQKLNQINVNYDALTNNLIQKKNYEKPYIFTKFLEENKLVLKNIDVEYKLVLTLTNIIAISGDSGSGKTFLLKSLSELFSNSLLQFEGDRYHKWERDDNNWNNYTHLDPSANYLDRMSNDIFNLKINDDIIQVDYDHKTGKFTEKNKIESKSNIIFSGLHSLIEDKVNKLYNLKIFIDTDKKLKYYWKIKRDMNERGYSREDTIKKIKKRLNDFNKHILPQKENSDFIINFFTDENWDYLGAKEPIIYLRLIIKNINIGQYFITKLNKFNIKFEITNVIIFTFYSTQKEFLNLFLDISNNLEISNINIDYYLIIKTLILIYRII